MLLILLTVGVQVFVELQDVNEVKNLFDEDYYHINIRGTSPHPILAGRQSLYT